MARDGLTNSIGYLSSRSYNTSTRLQTTNKQRRNLVTDDFDKEYTASGEDGADADIWLAISPDMIYIERWELKIIVPPKSDVTDLTVWLDGYDFTPMFKAQFPAWIGGVGMYPDTSMENRFDILKALTVFESGEKDRFLTQGYHLVSFKAPNDFTIKIREFKKYSFVNRQGGLEDEVHVDD